MFCTRAMLNLGAGVALESSPMGKDRSGTPWLFVIHHSSVHSEEGWETPCYPRRASYGAPSELLAGESKWRSESHSIGVG